MMADHFLVTGALGCIGAWVVSNLVRENTAVTVFDLAAEPRRLKLVLSPEALARVEFVAGDIADRDALDRALAGRAITHLVHLAALQVPFCKADPPLGALVNVVGTVNAFEAVKKTPHIRRLVYASSAVVYGDADNHPAGVPVAHDAPLHPNTLYGVYKLANEGTARVYWQDDRVSSIGLRPYVVYGVGRAFIAAARAPFEGAAVFNLTGAAVHMHEVVSAIEAAAPEMQGKITFEERGLPFPEEIDGAPLARAIGPHPVTPLVEGVAWTIRRFRELVASGQMAPDAMLK
jgi:UDP-glucuronate 4-epimerase